MAFIVSRILQKALKTGKACGSTGLGPTDVAREPNGLVQHPTEVPGSMDDAWMELMLLG